MQGTRNFPEGIYDDYLPSQLGLVITGHIFTLLETQTGQSYISIVWNIKNKWNSNIHH